MERNIVIFPKELETNKIGWDDVLGKFTTKPVDGDVVLSWDDNHQDISLTYWRPGSLDQNQALLLGQHGNPVYEWTEYGELLKKDHPLIEDFTRDMPGPVQEPFRKLMKWANKCDPTTMEIFEYFKSNGWQPAVYPLDLEEFPGLDGTMKARQDITLVSWEGLEKAGWLPQKQGPDIA